MYQTPRFFAQRSRTSKSVSSGFGKPVHVIDNFFCAGNHGGEWTVTIGSTGTLQVWSSTARSTLPPDVLSQLSFNEVASSTKARLLNVQSLHLFHLQSLDEPVNTIGLSDPIHLNGVIRSAFDGVDGDCLEGQLTVSRYDLIDGIINGAEFAYQYAADSNRGKAARCFSFLLPGDRPEETKRGKDLVVVYPMMPLELIDMCPKNESLVAEILYLVLSNLKRDLQEENAINCLLEMELPVPNRYDLEQRLIGEGYQINGDVATRPKHSSYKGFYEPLLSVLGKIAQEKIVLPPSGDVDDFVEIAKDATRKLFDYPPPSTVALRSCCAPVTSEMRSILYSGGVNDAVRRLFGRRKP